MSIKTGDAIPEANLAIMTEDGPQPVNTGEYFADRKVVLFSVPGAFTPTCSARHLPGFVDHLGELQAKGADKVACVAVNDVFVMHAWGQSANADGIDMLADGNGEFATALGLEMDGTAFGMGQRSQRFALIAENGIVTQLFVEPPGQFHISSAEHVLSEL